MSRARMAAQALNTPKGRLATLVGTGALAVLAPLVMHFEGKRNVVYQDIAGIPTVCYGHTGGDVRPGQEYTDAQCVMLLFEDLLKHADALDCLHADVRQRLTDTQTAAFISFAYNIGVARFCRSTLAKKANAGYMHLACAELSRWNKVGKRPVAGLTRRRAAERALCEEGLPVDDSQEP